MLELIAQGVTDIEALAGQAREGRGVEGSLGRAVGSGLPAVAAAGGRNHSGLGGGDEGTPGGTASVEQDSGCGSVRGPSPNSLRRGSESVPAVRNRRGSTTAIARPKAAAICPVCPLETAHGRQRRRLGGGAPHRQDRLSGEGLGPTSVPWCASSNACSRSSHAWAWMCVAFLDSKLTASD